MTSLDKYSEEWTSSFESLRAGPLDVRNQIRARDILFSSSVHTGTGSFLNICTMGQISQGLPLTAHSNLSPNWSMNRIILLYPPVPACHFRETLTFTFTFFFLPYVVQSKLIP
jgi:hypothetical protein